MPERLQTIVAQIGLSPEALLILGIGVGVLMLFLAAASAMSQRSPAAVRMAALQADRRVARQDRGLLRAPNADPKGLMKPFLPTDKNERTELDRKLAQAGFDGQNALRNFTLIRVVMGLLLPGVLLALILASKSAGVPLPFGLSATISGFSNQNIFVALSVLVFLGYYGPTSYLNSRAGERQRKIREAFPNALDLMQISIEAGLGFDAAMTRVGNELSSVSPEIAREFLTVQRQIAAGRPRDLAMLDMANRTGVEMVRSFANVVKQSMEFGTSMSQALMTYADEMRAYREMKAQEMAAKLPVKMSGVLALLLMPVLLMMTAGPVAIRMIRMFE